MKKLIYVVLIAAGLVGCEVLPQKPPKTPLEIQAIQARTFDTDKATAFKSVMSVLQDLGYVVVSASLETGFITAESTTKNDSTSVLLFGHVTKWESTRDDVRTEQKTAVTAFIEDMSKTTAKVRLNFVDRKYLIAKTGQRSTNEHAVEDKIIYDNAFNKIGEAIFIRNGQK